MIEETVRIGRDNTIDLAFIADGSIVPITSFTKVVLEDDAGVLADISSDDYPAAFDWDNGTRGKLIMSLGVLSGYTYTEGKYVFKIIVFYPGTTNGIEWDRMIIVFKD